MALHNRRDFLAGSAALALTACGGGGGGGGSSATTPPVATPPVVTPTPSNPTQTALTFGNAGVHDPSVIKADGTFYVFGSHLAAAKTTDLMNWTKIGDGVNNANPIFGNKVTTELAEALAWAKTDTLWAPDVTKLADGKFYMYYCACKGDSPLSALGIAVADKVDGPYVNKQLLLKSGMAGASEDGSTYNANIHPNVVDPSVFPDATGKLWMIYGSYSGGIFILQLNATTGMPLAGQGYGKHLMGGNHARIEGAYVLYSPATKYYYLFVSFGGLGAGTDGGYNVRVARSLSPDGPYVDGAGKDMSTVKGAAGTFFDDASITPHGMKLMGAHQFANASGETGTALGYISPGHNSAYLDAATGQLFMIFHTRFPGTGEAHEIRVHEMHLNEDGWPVIAPLRYAPLSLASPAQTADVSAAQAAGSYKLVNHGKDIAAAAKGSINVTLNTDGTVSGGLTGTWTHNGANKLSVVSGGTTYKGVLSRQWNTNASAFVVSFSALSAGGVSLWAIRT
ncbi:glycoside hydrolase family 43 protein [Roseateles sp. LKC17W]|uniref:Glycoside hydrolase family 43 protein n=1 Tax=Pelomonas margarita TaxID=3299031 RepID=A0ABW7FEI5_9BURK